MTPTYCTLGGPKSPPQASQCDSYAALWQTEHPGVFMLFVEASHFVAEVIGQKQSLVLIGFIKVGWGRTVIFLYCNVITRCERFLFFSSFEDWLQC